MDDSEARALCLALLHADSEAKVIELLSEGGYWNDPSAWRYYGDVENNFSVVGNQMSRPDAALVEKLSNSIDARLTNECLEHAIDPEGSLAPATIHDAVAIFFGEAKGPGTAAGRISNWPDTKRREVARGITLAATGYGPREGTKKPCFTVADAGEGQTPDMMPDTLLSLIKSNKRRIPFVQGKFNMGSTGVLPFCGENHLQLIVTRRNPKLVEASPKPSSDGKWGFTVVRREDPVGSAKHSTTTYLAPLGASGNSRKGGVLRFVASEMPLFPEGRQPYGRKASFGTLVKLYEYAAAGYSNTNILLRDGLLSRFDLLLPGVALPIRLHECRQTYAGHKGSFETTLTGLGVRLDDNKGENLESDFPSSCPLGAQGEQMTATIFAFKKGRAETYRRNEGIIFTFNGQTHGHLTLDFFRRKDVGLSYLSDSILVFVDCSRFAGRAFEDLFMASRDRLRGGPLRGEIEHALEDMLKNHKALSELKNRRREQEIADRLEDAKPLEDILQNLLRTSPTLANFFLRGNRASNPFKSLKVKAKDVEYHGRQFPTYFKFKGREYGQQLAKECHSNMRCRLIFESDVVNDYFSRGSDPGEFSLYRLVDGKRQPATAFVGPNLNNGIGSLSIVLPEDCNEGETLAYVAVVTDPTRNDPFENSFTIRVIGPHSPTGREGGRRKPPSEEEGEDRELPAGIALPKIIRVKEEKWAEQNPPFDKYTALRIKHATTEGEGDDESVVYDFYINVDNAHLKGEMKASAADDRLTESRFIYGMVLIGLALLQQKAVDAKRKKHVGDEEDEAAEEPTEAANGGEAMVENITRAVAPVLLPMIEALGELDAEAVSAISASGEAT